MADEAPGWGPDGRRAAVALVFDGLAGSESAVSPALPRLLDILAERNLDATFFADAAVVASEALALDMIVRSRHELAARVAPPDTLGASVAALRQAGHEIVGARLARGATGEGAGLGLTYVATDPGEPAPEGIARITLDARLLEAAERGPQAWHPVAQLAVGQAVDRASSSVLPFEPAELERGDALGAFAETLDLIAGLARAGTLWVPTVADLAT
jgi:hypothetical protein